MAKNENVNELDEMFDDAEASGETQTLVPKHFKFEEPGARLTGYLRAVDTCKGESEGTYKRYTIQTDMDLVSCVCGTQVDSILGDGRYMDALVRITYLGTEKLKGGRSMNKYDVKLRK